MSRSRKQERKRVGVLGIPFVIEQDQLCVLALGLPREDYADQASKQPKIEGTETGPLVQLTRNMLGVFSGSVDKTDPSLPFALSREVAEEYPLLTGQLVISNSLPTRDVTQIRPPSPQINSFEVHSHLVLLPTDSLVNVAQEYPFALVPVQGLLRWLCDPLTHLRPSARQALFDLESKLATEGADGVLVHHQATAITQPDVSSTKPIVLLPTREQVIQLTA